MLELAFSCVAWAQLVVNLAAMPEVDRFFYAEHAAMQGYRKKREALIAVNYIHVMEQAGKPITKFAAEEVCRNIKWEREEDGKQLSMQLEDGSMVTLEDVMIAARTVYGEARGEDFEGKKLVAHVLINRWRGRHRGETTLAGVCTEPWQFSAWNPDDPNRGKLQQVTVDERVFRQCLRAVLEALDEPDPTAGATHYHTRSVSPRWAAGKAPVLEHGRHRFYNDVA